MEQSRVYIALYYDNKESLFYQKDVDTYYDLKSKKDVTSNEIQLASLIPYSNVIKCKLNTKANIIKLYDMDRIQQMELNRIYIGNLYQMKRGSGTKLIKANLLLQADFEILNQADFTNLQTGEFYRRYSSIEYEEPYISPRPENIHLFSDVVGIRETSMEKGKILEKYREFKRRNN